MAVFFSSSGARLLAGALFILLLSLFFQRFVRAAGWRLFFTLALISGIIFLYMPLAPIIGLAMLAALYFWAMRRSPQPDKQYEAAMARIEGGGIKRGLSAPEASILLGKRLNLTLTLLLFEMLRKGILQQSSAAPFTVELTESFRTHGRDLSSQARGEHRRKAAQAISATLLIYEEAFLEILESRSGKAAHEIDYDIAIRPLIRYVASRVGGFDLSESRAYYASLIERAPKEARTDGVLTFERQKVFDHNFPWLLLGENFQAVLDQTDYSFNPNWWREGSFSKPKASFAEWTKQVIESMAGVVSEKELNLELESESDLLSATLMNEIARATFYG